MTVGVGGSTAETELAAIKNMRGDVPPFGVEERLQRIARAQSIMREKGIDALYLDVSSSMTYFTGLNSAAPNACTVRYCRRRATSSMFRRPSRSRNSRP